MSSALCRLLCLPMSFRRLDLDALWLSDLQVSSGGVGSEGRVCGVGMLRCVWGYWTVVGRESSKTEGDCEVVDRDYRRLT